MREEGYKLEQKTTNYSFMLILIATFNFYHVAYILKRSTESSNEAKKYSEFTIAIMAIWDAFSCLFHVVLAMELEVICLYIQKLNCAK